MDKSSLPIMETSQISYVFSTLKKKKGKNQQDLDTSLKHRS